MRILTFDIEDWFHILDNKSTRDEQSWKAFPSRIDKNIDLIFEILHRYNQKATFFCLGWIAEKNPELIKRIISNGFEIGSHSYSHQLVYEQNPDDFRRDLKKSIAILEDLSGQKIKYYRAPGFSIRRDCFWTFEILAEAGIELDCSVFPARRNHGGLPSFNTDGPAIIDYKGIRIKELPVSVKRISGVKMIFSGGGYFRVFPYWLIRRLVWNSDYLMSYFHPRDFDPSQPRLRNMEPSRYFKTYVGLSGATDKINSLLRDFSFVNVTNAANSIDWNEVETIKF
jgi:polysaccharide deacetylase family protein (PEP-CTERM system associated)